MWSFIRDTISSNLPLIGMGLVWLWHTIGGSTADAVDQRVKEVADAAIKTVVSAADNLGMPLDQLREKAKQWAQTAIFRLNIPLKGPLVGLLEHEIDVAMAQVAHERELARLAAPK